MFTKLILIFLLLTVLPNSCSQFTQKEINEQKKQTDNKKTIEEAFTKITKDVELHPGSATTHYNLGVGYMLNGSYNQALTEFKKAVKLKPDYVDAQLAQAEIFIKQRKFNKAFSICHHILKLNPDAVIVHNLLAKAYLYQKKMANAEKELKTSLKKNPDFLLTYLSLAEFYQLQNKNDEAKEWYRKAISIAPRNADAHFKLGLLCIKTKDYDEAITTLKAMLSIEKEKGVPLIYDTIGIALEGKQLFNEAIIYFNKALKIDPSFLIARQHLGNIYVKQQKYNKAINEYRHILKIAPHSIQTQISLAMTLEIQGDINAAISQYEKILTTNVKIPVVYNNLAYLYAENGIKLEEALVLVRKATELNPDDLSIQDTLGWVYYMRGDYNSAIDCLEKVKNKEIDNPWINYHLGMAYYKNNLKEKAFAEFQLALKHPNFNRKAEIEKLLQ